MTAKIIIASTLKPVWDPRAYEKLGKSLAQTRKYSVELIGSGQNISSTAGIVFHPHPSPRNLLSRLILPFKILRIVLRQQPDLLIVTTHELLLPAVIYRLLSGNKLIYDIQENYNYNLRYQAIYPPGLRHLMAWYIRAKEVILQGFFSRFMLAEKCYLDEINILKRRPDKCLVLENKCARIFPLKDTDHPSKVQLLFSGTISEIYGVKEAISFYEKLPHEQYELTIIGHCPNKHLRHYLNTAAAKIPGINLEVSTEPIPHEQIGVRFTKQTIGLLPYRDNKSINQKVPTKLFDYLANGLPVLISPNPGWEKFIREYARGQAIDFNSTPNKEELDVFFTSNKETLNTDIKHFMWNSIENYFLTTVDKVLAN